MPSRQLRGRELAGRSTPTRTTAVLMPASLTGRPGREPSMTSTATELTVAAWPDSRRDCCAVATRHRGLRRLRAGRRLPAARRCRRAARAGRPVRAARPRRRGVPAGGEAAHGARRRSPRLARRSSSPTAKRASRRRSRTGGCCATGRIWCSTGCGWPPRMVGAAAPTSTSPTRSRPPRSARALAELDPRPFGGTAVSVVTVEPGYVAGEETAAVRRINGGPGQTDRQAAAAVRGRRVGPADDGQQCRDAGQPALHP